MLRTLLILAALVTAADVRPVAAEAPGGTQLRGAAASAAERLRLPKSTLLARPAPAPAVAARAVAARPLTLPAVRSRAGVPLIAAGAVLFVAGAVIGDDAGTLLMLGGAGMAAYGVYQYTR